MTNKDDDNREERLLAYLRGEMTDAEAQHVEADVAADEQYARRLERLLLGEEQDESAIERHVLPEEKQRAIIRRGKWRMRLSNSAFTMGLAFVAGAVLLFVNGWIGSLWHDDLYRVTKDMVNFTQPGLTVGSSGSEVGLLYGNINMELREQVGADQKNVGFFESTNFLWLINAKPKWTNGIREKKLFLRYPTENVPPEETAYLRTPAWNTMENLPEGTVSQLAISFDHMLTYDEYQRLIAKHVNSDKQDTVWFAVDTGQELKNSEAEEGNLMLSAGDVWGYSERELDYGNAPIQVNGEADRRAAAYMAEMKYLSEQERLSRNIGETLLGGSDKAAVGERYRYLQEHGVRIYGAVLTGPTKDLLKLREEPAITAAFLGKVDWWNWNRPAASGVEYSW